MYYCDTYNTHYHDYCLQTVLSWWDSTQTCRSNQQKPLNLAGYQYKGPDAVTTKRGKVYELTKTQCATQNLAKYCIYFQRN